MTSEDCVVPSCNKEFHQPPYFGFPKDKNFCLKWLLAIPKGSWVLNESAQVCSRHFEDDAIVKENEESKLLPEAIPCFFLENPDIRSKGDSLKIPEPSSSSEPANDKKSSTTVKKNENDSENTIKIDIDDSESDLEIIEPEIETFEVSDTSDVEEVKVESKAPNPELAPGEKITKSKDKLECCVPRCGSVTGNPEGIGFHAFPRFGETKLSVRAVDNKITIHDLYTMWKSLLSVTTAAKNTYVCTRHFTSSDYTGNVLNKLAVPTQYLPTPVQFAPCRVTKEYPARSRPYTPRKPFVYKPIQPRPITPITPIRPQQPQTPGGFRSFRPRYQSIAKAPQKRKLGCSIPDCPNKTVTDTPITLFKLPSDIDRFKEWVYSCGHPEWLDDGMTIARYKHRICCKHFDEKTFVDKECKILKGSAKPTINVQEPYKKCIVETCHNYFDKDRLHHVGVTFADFPSETKPLQKWIKAIKRPRGVPIGSVQVTEEDLEKFKDAVICSLHFKSTDYLKKSEGNTLSPDAVPSMNLVPLKEKEPVEERSENSGTGDKEADTTATRQRSQGSVGSSGGHSQYGGSEDLNQLLNETAIAGDCEMTSGVTESDSYPRRRRRKPRASRFRRWRRKPRVGEEEPKPEGKRTRRRRREVIDDESLTEQEAMSVGDASDAVEEGDTGDNATPPVRRGRRGRPLRKAVLKRKTLIDEESEEEGSDGEPLPKRTNGNDDDNEGTSNSNSTIPRTRRPRRAAAVNRKIFIDDSDSNGFDQRKSVEDWQEDQHEYSDGEQMGKVGGLHFLVDSPIEIDSLVETNDDTPEPQPSEQMEPDKPGSQDEEGFNCEVDPENFDRASQCSSNGEDDGIDVSCIVETQMMEDGDECSTSLDHINGANPEENGNEILQNDDGAGEDDDGEEESATPYGPALPKPTPADLEFFRSILPAVSAFNELQKSDLKSTIVSTLKTLLCYDIILEEDEEDNEENEKEGKEENEKEEIKEKGEIEEKDKEEIKEKEKEEIKEKGEIEEKDKEEIEEKEKEEIKEKGEIEEKEKEEIIEKGEIEEKEKEEIKEKDEIKEKEEAEAAANLTS